MDTTRNIEVRVLWDAQAKLGECPRWDEQRQRLYWVDIESGRLHELEPATREHRYLQLDQEIGCFALRAQGGFVAGLRTGLVTIDSIEGGDITPICDPEQDKPHQRFNDGRCDVAGRFIAGTMNPNQDELSGHFYVLDGDGECRRLIGDAWFCNGLAFSLDGKTMYYSDSRRRVIYACDYDLSNGVAANERELLRLPLDWGEPDGAAVDSEGYYWIALNGAGRIARLSPMGEVVDTIAVPTPYPTMVAFGGPDLRTLYVTSERSRCTVEELLSYPFSGGIFELDAYVPGLPEPRFKG